MLGGSFSIYCELSNCAQLLAMRKHFTFIFLATFALLQLACTNPKVADLKAGVAKVKSRLSMVNRDPMSAIAFSNIVETGGSPVSYIYAGLDENEKLPELIWEEDPKPWTIVLGNGDEDGELIVKGYGDDLKEPLVIEKIAIRPASFDR